MMENDVNIDPPGANRLLHETMRQTPRGQLPGRYRPIFLVATLLRSLRALLLHSRQKSKGIPAAMSLEQGRCKKD